MPDHRICVIVPCWKRPARTRRIINNILAQDINNWEAFVLGDGCDQFQSLFESGEAKYFQDLAASKGNKLHMFNFEKNYGGFGYHIMNYGIKHNNSNYVIFAGNDDIIAPDHFRHYLSEIENTDLDIVAYKTFMKFLPITHCFRPVSFNRAVVGHAEIIVKSSTARLFEHTPEYGHDWLYIKNILDLGRAKIAQSDHFTYYVTHCAAGPAEDYITFKFENID